MSHPLRRMVSSSQVSDWFTMGGRIDIPSRKPTLIVDYLVQGGGGGGANGTSGVTYSAGGAGGIQIYQVQDGVWVQVSGYGLE